MEYTRRNFIKFSGLSLLPFSAGCINNSDSKEIRNSRKLILEPKNIKKLFDLNWVKSSEEKIDMNGSDSSYEVHILSPDNDGSGITHQLGVYESVESAEEKYNSFRSKSSNIESINLGDDAFYFGKEGSKTFATIYVIYDDKLIKTTGAPFSINDLSRISTKQIEKLDRINNS